MCVCVCVCVCTHVSVTTLYTLCLPLLARYLLTPQNHCSFHRQTLSHTKGCILTHSRLSLLSLSLSLSLSPSSCQPWQRACLFQPLYRGGEILQLLPEQKATYQRGVVSQQLEGIPTNFAPTKHLNPNSKPFMTYIIMII